MALIIIMLIIIVVAVVIWLVDSGYLKVPDDQAPVQPDTDLDPDLLRATGGDRALAQRLLQQVRLRYPGQSERWYVEKVIYDLRRDHGSLNFWDN